MARLSIIIPSKNEQRYIGVTLAQFEPWLEQFDLEIIVSDANSADGTAETVREYIGRWGHARLKLVQSAGKQNIAIGRNLGAAAAAGDILLHTDADVRIPHPERFFSEMLAHFDDPGVVAATCPLQVYPEEAIWQDKAYHLFMNGVIRLSFALRIYLAKGECQFARRSTFREIDGYKETIVAGEDCDLFYRLSKVGKILYWRRLSIHHSPRRFREYGYWRVSLIYLREGVWLLLRGKSYASEWTPVR